nr:putative interleukin-17 receptor E-like [Anolis sagrei ordinatus]
MLFKIQLFAVFWGTYGHQLLPRIEECGVTCSQGFLCKIQPASSILNSFCHDAPASLPPVPLRGMKLETVMNCAEQIDCSLHLSVKGTLHLDENIRGMEICSFSMETQASNCVTVKISTDINVNSAGRKVKVQFNCFEVNAGQHLHVTMKTLPNYCAVKRTQEYYVEDCQNSDVARNIPDCFVPQLVYEVDRMQKTISVNILEVTQDMDYYVRLCHLRFVCEDVGSVTVITEKDSIKAVSFHYDELLPCLCVEAWAAIPDARRIRVCPFKNDTKALWDNINYNPATQSLVWEAACPIDVSVSLCQLMETDDECVDLENTFKTGLGKVKYSQVDANPGLCMKFTTDHGSWVRCPFAHGNFQAWKMRLAVMEDHIEVSFMSHPEAKFSVLVCHKTESSSCNSTGIHQPISVVGLKSVSVNISEKTCGSNFCIQGWRTDVDYSIPSYICDLPCTSSTRGTGIYENSFSILPLAALLAILGTMMALLGHKLFSVFHRKRNEKENRSHNTIQRLKSTQSSYL